MEDKEFFLGLSRILAEKIITQRVTPGNYFAFGNEGGSAVSVTPTGVDHSIANGLPYSNKNILDCVDDKLKQEETVGFATNSKVVLEYLIRTGKFVLNDIGMPVAYQRGERIWAVI